MAQTTDEAMVEAMRFRKNSEESSRSVEDETRIEEIAQFIMVTATEIDNPSLSAKLRDVANQLVINKGDLARKGGQGVSSEQPPQEVDPEQAAMMQAQQMAQQQGGFIPPGAAPV